MFRNVLDDPRLLADVNVIVKTLPFFWRPMEKITKLKVKIKVSHHWSKADHARFCEDKLCF